MLVSLACIWLEPSVQVWMAGKLMARRAYILSGRLAHRETWEDWCKDHEVGNETRRAH